MKISIILFVTGAILWPFPFGITALLSLLCFITGFILLITQSTAKIKNKKDYTAEAQRACEDVAPKRKRDETPPWEK